MDQVVDSSRIYRSDDLPFLLLSMASSLASTYQTYLFYHVHIFTLTSVPYPNSATTIKRWVRSIVSSTRWLKAQLKMNATDGCRINHPWNGEQKLYAWWIVITSCDPKTVCTIALLFFLVVGTLLLFPNHYSLVHEAGIGVTKFHCAAVDWREKELWRGIVFMRSNYQTGAMIRLFITWLCILRQEILTWHRMDWVSACHRHQAPTQGQ